MNRMTRTSYWASSKITYPKSMSLRASCDKNLETAESGAMVMRCRKYNSENPELCCGTHCAQQDVPRFFLGRNNVAYMWTSVGATEHQPDLWLFSKSAVADGSFCDVKDIRLRETGAVTILLITFYYFFFLLLLFLKSALSRAMITIRVWDHFYDLTRVGQIVIAILLKANENS